MTPERLKEILDSVRNQTDLQPHDGITYCNIAIDRILGLCGIPRIINPLTGQPHLANSMIDYLEANTLRWGKVNGFAAHSYANLGALVIAGAKNPAGHGHVAPLSPAEKMGFSPSWGKDVPMLSNVGKKNAILRASQAFRTEPSYYAYRIPQSVSLEVKGQSLGIGNGEGNKT